MKADGIIEEFMNSIDMHGLKFNKLIGKKYLYDLVPEYSIMQLFNFVFNKKICR